MSQSNEAIYNAQEVDLISTLTHHLTSLGAGSSVVTLKGFNKGTVTKAVELIDDNATEDNGEEKGDEETEMKVSVYGNSNYQMVNNSIMGAGKCDVEDPGVHIEFVDCIDDHEEKEEEDDEREKKIKQN